MSPQSSSLKKSIQIRTIDPLTIKLFTEIKEKITDDLKKNEKIKKNVISATTCFEELVKRYYFMIKGQEKNALLKLKEYQKSIVEDEIILLTNKNNHMNFMKNLKEDKNR